ncbi:glutamate 5-kinase [Aliikangiella sp. IMCC44653]
MNYQNCNRIVIKVGSALIAPDGENSSSKYLLAIARFIHQCHEDGKLVVLVSSGSVAAGRAHIEHQDKIPSTAKKQAMAAVGQTDMMANWGRLFDFPCAQILVTHDDLRDRNRYQNIQNTISELLANQILPVVNENDSVATEELKVGNNDSLAAMVAVVCEADLLMICSDIDGLFTADPNSNPDATLINHVEKITPEIYAMAGGTANSIGTGGMQTKLEAAEIATSNGIETLIINGFKGEEFEKLIVAKPTGTWFQAHKETLPARKHWLNESHTPKGRLELELSAINNLLQSQASLMSAGIKSINGEFEKGEAVDVYCQHTQSPIARGIVEFSHLDLKKMSKKAQLQTDANQHVIIHRDNFVLL